MTVREWCSPAFHRGHGTYSVDGKLLASVAGVVERVNKLIYVKPLKSRYSQAIPTSCVPLLRDKSVNEATQWRSQGVEDARAQFQC